MDGKSVLGIDAAWTATQPSGVALVVEGNIGWRLAAVSPSYSHFIAAAEGRQADSRANRCAPDVPALLTACEKLNSNTPSIVAVDMPLSMKPIISRRVSDNLVSKAYGSRHCATHTPSATRPGRISDKLRVEFADAGYPLQTNGQPKHGLIEVYPHPALVELTGATRRLPYKISKVGSYWRDSTPAARRQLVISEWQKIVALLDDRISGVAAMLQFPQADRSVSYLKAFEDQIDAVICAWVGICVLEERALPFGDAESAIWIPLPLDKPSLL